MTDPTCVLRAEQVAELPPEERQGWETSSGLCIGCSARPPTRLDQSAPAAERAGVGFYTCKPCRDHVQTHGFERPGWVGSSRFPPNAKRDAGLCMSCGGPAQRRTTGAWIGNAARANAELAGTTVARMSTDRWCAKCNPARRPKCNHCKRRRAAPNRKSCPTCLEGYVKYQAKSYAKDPELYRKRARDRYSARVVAGLCRKCGKHPVKPGIIVGHGRYNGKPYSRCEQCIA